jgi:phospholipid N-methyltransferase
MSFLSECRAFWRESRRHFHTTGSVMPSSRFLARALARPLDATKPPRRILEVGPGTGSVTREIVRRLQPGDRLDCVELNEQFVERLRKCFVEDPAFVPYQSQVTIIHGPLESLPGTDVYDHVISGLPLNAFPVGLVRDVFHAYRRLLKPGGLLSYFEYILIREMKLPISSRNERDRLARIGRITSHYIRKHQRGCDRVFMNVPPAIARHLELRPTASRKRA